jgi:hypothetical protein
MGTATVKAQHETTASTWRTHRIAPNVGPMASKTKAVYVDRQLVGTLCQIWNKTLLSKDRKGNRTNKQKISLNFTIGVHDLLQHPTDLSAMHLKLKYYKAKIIQLHNQQLQHLQAVLRDATPAPGEKMSLFQIIWRQKRRTSNLISTITDMNGITHSTQHDISRTFYTELQALFDHLPTLDEQTNTIYQAISTSISTDTQKNLDRPITLQELQIAIAQAPRNKSPGIDGITAEFYQWGANIVQDLLHMYNDYFETERTSQTFAKGVIVCISKTNPPPPPNYSARLPAVDTHKYRL